jgi:hypothetical protein
MDYFVHIQTLFSLTCCYANFKSNYWIKLLKKEVNNLKKFYEFFKSWFWYLQKWLDLKRDDRGKESKKSCFFTLFYIMKRVLILNRYYAKNETRFSYICQ